MNKSETILKKTESLMVDKDFRSALKYIESKSLEISKNREDIDWVDVNSASFSGTLKALPERESLDTDINENLIIELYSK